MKPTLEDLRRSAEFCGYKTSAAREWHERKDVIYVLYGGARYVWNPPEDADRDRELLHKLLEAGYTVVFNEERGDKMIHSCFYIHPEILRRDIVLRSDCHPNDFLTLAASKLQEMKDD